MTLGKDVMRALQTGECIVVADGRRNPSALIQIEGETVG